MSRTLVQAGNLVAGYVDDGQGRRLILGDPGKHGAIQHPLVLAMTQREAFALIGVLRGLLEELPP